MRVTTKIRRVGFILLLGLAVGSTLRLADAQVGATLSGVLRYNGDVMPDFPVSLYSADQIVETQTDAQGRFEFGNLPPGVYDLQASFHGVEGTIYGIRIGRANLGPLVVDAELVRVVYPLDADCGRTFWSSYEPGSTAAGHVTGSVLLYPDVPLPNRLVTTARVDLVREDQPRARISLHPDENGNFDFKNVPPGRYSLRASRRGYRKVQSTIWVAQKDNTSVKIILVKHGYPLICE